VTQTVLKNEITELAPRTWMDADKRKEIADGVANILADAYRLLINTQGLHWNVEGPMFYSLHKLTEDHYRELFESTDELAERIRALGLPAPQSIRELSERSVLTDLPDDAKLEIAESNRDVKTADMLTERIGVYEENAWMLRATIAS
jgi:starvation-inducible DNA-binding protein